MIRRELIDYYAAAMQGGFPAAGWDAARAECMSDEEVIQEARRLGLLRTV